MRAKWTEAGPLPYNRRDGPVGPPAPSVPVSFTRYHIAYSAEEDRIFVFVREGHEVEHAFGISRRLTKRMWPKMLKAFPEARARIERVPVAYQNEVRKLTHEGTVSKAKETGALAPERLAEVRQRHDYLTKAVRITRRKNGARSLVFVSAEKQLKLPLSAHYVLFCEALHTVVGKTDWDIVLHYPWEMAVTPPPGADGDAPPPLRH